eukprot:238847_1
MYTTMASLSTVIGEQTLPRGISGHCIGYDYNNQTVLIFGTYQFVKFNPITRQFTDVNETYLAQEIHGTGDFFSQHGDILWIIPKSRDMILTINTNTYIEHRTDIIIPSSFDTRSCLAATDNYLFIVGGGAPSIDLVQVYNITSQHWFNAPSLHTARRSLSCIATGNKLYAFGGKNQT